MCSTISHRRTSWSTLPDCKEPFCDYANLSMLILSSCFGLNMLTTLPLETFVCREVMTTYFFPDEPFNSRRHLIFTTSLVFTSTAIALVTCDLGIVFELIGATSAASLAYIFPPLCYIKLSSGSWREKIPAFVCVGFGFVVMGVSIVQTIAKIIRGSYCYRLSQSFCMLPELTLSYRRRGISYLRSFLSCVAFKPAQSGSITGLILVNTPSRHIWSLQILSAYCMHLFFLGLLGSFVGIPLDQMMLTCYQNRELTP